MRKLLLAIAVVVGLMVPGQMSADSIIPNLISITPRGDGTFDWAWSLEISGSSLARSAGEICSDASTTAASGGLADGNGGCPGPPVLGSAMFNFYDFAGAVDYFKDPPQVDFTSLIFDGTDALFISNAHVAAGAGEDWDDTAALGGQDWFTLIYPEGGDVVGGDGISDFGPPVPTGAASCGFGPACPPDSPQIMNVLLAYADGPVIDPTLEMLPFVVYPGIGAYFELGTLVIRSVYGTQSPVPEAYYATDWSIGQTPHERSNDGLYLPPQIPEPTSLLLLGTGLLGIGSRLRKKIKKNNQPV